MHAKWTYALDACDFYHRSCVFSTNKGLVNDYVLGKSVNAKGGIVPPNPSVEGSGSSQTLDCAVGLM